MKHMFGRPLAGLLAAVALLLAVVVPALAHATFPDGSAVPQGGEGAVIHVRIPHGCNGAPTDEVSVELPDGVINAKPEALAGWVASTERVPSAPYTLWGTEYTDRVGVVTWSGGSLPADQFLDFGISAIFDMEPGTYTVPVIQRCGADSVSWTEVPAQGQTEDDLEHPAPTFTVVASGAEQPAVATVDPLTYAALLLGAVALAVSVANRRTGAKRR